MAPPIIFDLLSGLRRAELPGLRWQDDMRDKVGASEDDRIFTKTPRSVLRYTHSFPLVPSHPCAARLFCYFSLFRSAKFYLNLTVRCKICRKTFDLILSYVNIQGALPTGKGPILCL